MIVLDTGKRSFVEFSSAHHGTMSVEEPNIREHEPHIGIYATLSYSEEPEEHAPFLYLTPYDAAQIVYALGAWLRDQRFNPGKG